MSRKHNKEIVEIKMTYYHATCIFKIHKFIFKSSKIHSYFLFIIIFSIKRKIVVGLKSYKNMLKKKLTRWRGVGGKSWWTFMLGRQLNEIRRKVRVTGLEIAHEFLGPRSFLMAFRKAGRPFIIFSCIDQTANLVHIFFNIWI